MTEPQPVIETLEFYAARAGDVRPDLADIVERRFRRRRRQQALGSATVVLIVVAIVAAAVAFGGLTDRTAKPIPATWTQDGPWRVPKPGAATKSLADVWPKAFVHLSVTAPDNGVAFPEADIDATHLLVAGANTYYSYDIVHKTFTVIMHVGQPLTDVWAEVSPHWLVVDIYSHSTTAFTSDVYRAPLSGGTAQYVGKVGASAGQPSPWFVTDDAIYWSGFTPGVMRLPMAGGTSTPVPGYSDFYVSNDSPWAVSYTKASTANLGSRSVPAMGGSVTKALKNMTTGAELEVTSDSRDASLECTPAFCVGSDDNGAYVQDLDRSEQVHVPALDALEPMSLTPAVGRSGLYTATDLFDHPPKGDPPGGQYVWDPLSGQFGVIRPTAWRPTSTGEQGGILAWPNYTQGGYDVLVLSLVH